MKKTQVTAEKTAWLEVVTLAQSHLTDARRAAPVTTGRSPWRPRRRSTTAVAFALKGLPRLDPGTRAALLDEAAALGVAPDRAERLIARGCRAARGRPRRRRRRPPRSRRRRPAPAACGAGRAAGVTDFAAARSSRARPDCRHCGASLHWTCPVCPAVHWVDEPRCPCGFRVELREPLVQPLRGRAAGVPRPATTPTALAHLRRVQELAPNHVGARKGVEKVKERVAEIDQARSDFEVARAGRPARRGEGGAPSLGPARRPDDPRLARRLHRGHPRAPRRPEPRSPAPGARERTDPAKARELYRRALALAADLPEARDGLDRCPPDAPVGPDRRVRRRPGPAPLVAARRPTASGPSRYVVLRKPDAALKHPGRRRPGRRVRRARRSRTPGSRPARRSPTPS